LVELLFEERIIVENLSSNTFVIYVKYISKYLEAGYIYFILALFAEFISCYLSIFKKQIMAPLERT